MKEGISAVSAYIGLRFLRHVDRQKVFRLSCVYMGLNSRLYRPSSVEVQGGVQNEEVGCVCEVERKGRKPFAAGNFCFLYTRGRLNQSIHALGSSECSDPRL
jgi:hypothetical protein